MSTIQFCDPKFNGYCTESLLNNEDDVTYADRIGSRFGVTGLNGTRSTVDLSGFDLDAGIYTFGLVSEEEIEHTLVNSDEIDDEDFADLFGRLLGANPGTEKHELYQLAEKFLSQPVPEDEQAPVAVVHFDYDDDSPFYDDREDAAHPHFVGTGKLLLTTKRDGTIRRYNR